MGPANTPTATAVIASDLRDRAGIIAVERSAHRLDS
jgi:hypothetical protein